MSHRRQRLRKIDIQIGLDLNTENNYTKKVKNNSQIQSGKDRRFYASVFSFYSLFFY